MCVGRESVGAWYACKKKGGGGFIDGRRLLRSEGLGGQLAIEAKLF